MRAPSVIIDRPTCYTRPASRPSRSRYANALGRPPAAGIAKELAHDRYDARRPPPRPRGEFVSPESHVTCTTCAYCRTGQGHICQNTRLIGIDRDGGFAEYIAIPAQNAWPNPPDLPLKISVLQENFGNAVHTAFAFDLRAKKVLVTGCGPVGLMTIAVARAIGARAIYGTDISRFRIDFARRMGADLE